MNLLEFPDVNISEIVDKIDYVSSKFDNIQQNSKR